MYDQEYDDELKQKILKINDLKSLKHFCEKNMRAIFAGEVERVNERPMKIRFLDQDGEFGIIDLGRCFFFCDCMYIMTTNLKYEDSHNEEVLDYILKEENLFSRSAKSKLGFAVLVMFAGFLTNFRDDSGESLFTGDVVEASVLVDPPYPSRGDVERARLDPKKAVRPTSVKYYAGIRKTHDRFSLVFDNHDVPLSWATALKNIGTVFYNLERGITEIDIEAECNLIAQSHRQDEIIDAIKKAPIFMDE